MHGKEGLLLSLPEARTPVRASEVLHHRILIHARVPDCTGAYDFYVGYQ